jgi:hypothetical protein
MEFLYFVSDVINSFEKWIKLGKINVMVRGMACNKYEPHIFGSPCYNI